MSGATDCQLETAAKQAPKRKTLHFCGLTGSHFKSRRWGWHFGNLRVAGEVWSDPEPARLRSEVWPLRCGPGVLIPLIKVVQARVSQVIEEGRTQVGTVAARHSGLYPHSRRQRQGFFRVCHGHQHLSWGCFGGSSPLFAQVGTGFTGDSERPHRARQRFEDLLADHASESGMGYA